MIHGDLKGVRFFLCGRGSSSILHSLFVKANILIDETGHSRLADFGLLTIISDPANRLPSSSYTQGGTARWMSPELIAPERFGLKNSRPTKPSDCYALGMVVYETISGNLPFHEDADLMVFMKVVEGKRPLRGARFTESLWKMLNLCWASQPNDRPSIEDVLQCLEAASNSSEPPSGLEEETERDDDDWDSATESSGVPNRTNDTTTTEWSTATSSHSSYLTNPPLSPVFTGSGIIDVVYEPDVDGPCHGMTGMEPPVSWIGSADQGTYQVSANLPHQPLTPRRTRCIGSARGF